MKILGLDPGTHCGWAARYDDHRMDAGTWDLSNGRHEGGGMRFMRLRRHLVEVIESFTPHLIAFEDVQRHLGTQAAHVYGGITAIIMEEAECRKIPYRSIPVAQIKKLATGKGNAKKAAMIAAANRYWLMALTDKEENEADARWIAETAARFEN